MVSFESYGEACGEISKAVKKRSNDRIVFLSVALHFITQPSRLTMFLVEELLFHVMTRACWC